jgi:molecular chaperone GrpE (heat shock protein)
MILSFLQKKCVEPVTAAIQENCGAVNILTERMSSQTAQTSLQTEHMLKTQYELSKQQKELSMQQKELSLQIEELYDCVSAPQPEEYDNIWTLVAALISVRDEIEHFRRYAQNDQELLRHVELLLKICDRKLFESGILKIEREGKYYDRKLDVATDTEYAPTIPQNVITKELSGCYKYLGEIVRRANVVICKGE